MPTNFGPLNSWTSGTLSRLTTQLFIRKFPNFFWNKLIISVWHHKLNIAVSNCYVIVRTWKYSKSKTALLEWYFKTITIQVPLSYQNSPGFQSISELISKLQHSHTSHLHFVSHLSVFTSSTSSASAQLIRICYLCLAATAVLDKEVFPTVPVKSGITYHFQSDSPLHSTASSTTEKLTTLPLTAHLATASSGSDSTLWT